MVEIHDLSDCPFSKRAGLYGGAAGAKDGIIFRHENWIIKYPGSTGGLRGNNLPSYTSSPLSEYIGSHVYKELGLDVHETILGYRNNKIVVACKDFCKDGETLGEIRTIKNQLNPWLSERLERDFMGTGPDHAVDLEETLLHLKYNPILKEADGLLERFWDMAVIDILINNNDRNNGNWGLIYKESGIEIAPVFDNGASFSNKASDEKIKTIMNDEYKIRNNALVTPTTFTKDGHHLSAKELLSYNDEVLKKELKKIVPIIQEKAHRIRKLFNEIPEEYKGIPICSKVRKDFYIKGMEIRFHERIYPAYEKIVEKQYEDYRTGDLE